MAATTNDQYHNTFKAKLLKSYEESAFNFRNIKLRKEAVGFSGASAAGLGLGYMLCSNINLVGSFLGAGALLGIVYKTLRHNLEMDLNQKMNSSILLKCDELLKQDVINEDEASRSLCISKINGLRELSSFHDSYKII